jgi:enoyl-[acyl-carrier protein] reductase II
MIGQISGMLDDIKSVKEIIDDIVGGIAAVVTNIQHKYE